MCYFTAPLQGLCVHEWVTTPLRTAPPHTVRVCSRLFMYTRGLTTLCVDTAACVCTCPASLQGVCTRTASERVRFMCTALLQRERVCVCMDKYVTALWLCVCLHVCMHKYTTARCLCVHTNTASLQRACACVHMRACTSTGLLQGLCVHKHVTARCLCVHAQAQHRCKVCAHSLAAVCVHAHRVCTHVCQGVVSVHPASHTTNGC